jgi:predicted nucleic acid-binding protein
MLLDSSAFIAFMNPSDQHNPVAVRLIAGAPSVEIHEVSVAESLVQASAKEAVSHVLAVIEGLEATVVNSSGLEGAVRIAGIRDRTGLPLPDCYVLDSAEQLGISVLSFDVRLNKSALKMGLRTFM